MGKVYPNQENWLYIVSKSKIRKKKGLGFILSYENENVFDVQGRKFHSILELVTYLVGEDNNHAIASKLRELSFYNHKSFSNINDARTFREFITSMTIMNELTNDI